MQREQSTAGLVSQARNTADRALAAFIIIQAAIKRSSCLKRFCCREDLNARMPNYQVGNGRRGCIRLALARRVTGTCRLEPSSPGQLITSRWEDSRTCKPTYQAGGEGHVQDLHDAGPMLAGGTCIRLAA